ncbi:hypothetical protein A4A49_39467 [Nicotiana attenuata]|uniref:Uncharacterized protein n=1 Tax=Nicotiana attenuata TaxID=49451 RepID=A0A1J6K4I3_NICAT|nr:hypothetical protein A4A49_39467 [Nicotiana attenuata]
MISDIGGYAYCEEKRLLLLVSLSLILSILNSFSSFLLYPFNRRIGKLVYYIGAFIDRTPVNEVILDRFSSGDATRWVCRAERYFHFLGFSEEHWLPLPYFYLEGAALIWFDWLYRNKQFYDWNHFKEKLQLHFRTQTFTSPVHIAEPQVCPVPVPAMSIVPILYAFASDLDVGHSEAYQMFDENPQGEWPHSQTVSSSDAKESLNECVRHDEDGEVKVSATSIIAESVFNTGNDHKTYDVHSNAPFIAPPIVVDVLANQSAGLHFQLTQVLGGTTRWAEIDFSVPIQPTESADKEASDHMIDSTSARNERHDFIAPGANFFITIRATAKDLCEWDPGISFKSKSLTGYTVNGEPLLLMGSTGMFFFFAYASSMTQVWDPGKQRLHNLYWTCYFTRPTTDFIADALVFSPHLGVVPDATGKIHKEGTAQAFQGVLVGQTGVNLRAQVTFAVIVIFDPGGGPLDAPILEYRDGVLEEILKAKANLSINNVPLSVDNVDFQATIHYLTKSEYGLSLYGFYFLVESRCAVSIRVNGAFLFESHFADSHKFTGAPGDMLRNMKGECNIDSTACVGILEPLELQLEVKGVFESIVEHFSTLSRKSNRQLITIDLRVVIRENKGCQGNCASRSKSCNGSQDTTMYFRCIGFTNDTSALIVLKAKWDTEQSAYDSAKSLWPSLSKIIIPSIEISEALPFVALLVMLVAQLALVMEGVLVFISTCDRDELATATYIPRFVLVIDVASMTIITRTIVATYGNANFVFECKSTCQLVAFTHVIVYIATFSLLLFFVEGFLDSNLEDKVLIEDGSIVMNQPQPSKDSNKDVTKITVGLRRAIGPRTSNWVRFIWNPG